MIAGTFFRREELLLNQPDLGVVVDLMEISRSTAQVQRRLIETTRLSHSRLIGNGCFRCVHVDRER